MTPAAMADPGQDLARWAASGDQAALERALAAAADPAYEQALRLLGRAADADDATQEALVQLTRSARRYDPSRPFRPWLARIVHDACCRLLRAGRRRRRHEAAAIPPTASEPSMDPEAVRAAVLGLPEPLRAAVELHYFAGLSQAEAALALGIGEGACAMRLSRARERLRDLLARQGLGAVTAAAALAVLSAAPAHAAPAGLAARIAGQAAAGSLPATTIPLTALQSGVWFMATHPVSTAIGAAVLTAALLVPFTMEAGEAARPAPPPAAVARKLSDPASALLPYLDPRAAFQVMLDLETLRPRLLQAKPFSLFADARLAPSIATARRHLEGVMGSSEKVLLFDLASAGSAISYALHDRILRKGSDEQRTLLAIDAGSMADALAAALAAEPQMSGTAPASIGRFTGLGILDENLFVGRDGRRLMLAYPPLLKERIQAAAATPPPAPAWFRMDAAAILAQYARSSGPDQDPAGVAFVLGAQWRGMRPVVEGMIDVDDHGLVGAVQAGGTAPLSPATLVTLLLGGTTRLPFSDIASWPLRKPRLAIPPSPDRIASCTLGLTAPRQKPGTQEQFFAKIRALRTEQGDANGDLLIGALLGRGVAVEQSRLVIASGDMWMLEALWSGDLALEVRSGAPLPRIALVLGLADGSDAAQVIHTLGLLLGQPMSDPPRAGAVPGAITAFTDLGQLTVTACADRLVLTWNADIAEWPGIATAATPAEAPACSLQIDLPAAARTWYPLAAMALPPELRPSLPPLPALLPHLPLYGMSWEATPDGCRIRERGLPLMTLMTAAAAARVINEADPEREVEAARRQLQQEPDPIAPPREF